MDAIRKAEVNSELLSEARRWLPRFPFSLWNQELFFDGNVTTEAVNPHYDGLRVISWANNVVYHACGAIQ